MWASRDAPHTPFTANHAGLVGDLSAPCICKAGPELAGVTARPLHVLEWRRGPRAGANAPGGGSGRCAPGGGGTARAGPGSGGGGSAAPPGRGGGSARAPGMLGGAPGGVIPGLAAAPGGAGGPGRRGCGGAAPGYRGAAPGYGGAAPADDRSGPSVGPAPA